MTKEKLNEMEQFFQDHDWLMGDNIVKRCFAMWGHVLLATLMFYVALFVVAFVIGMFGVFVNLFI